MRKAYYSALLILKDKDAARDASQEAFIRAYKNFDKYDENSPFYAWYYKILKNVCLNIIRHNKKFSSLSLYENLELPSEEDPCEKADRELMNKAVSEALESLGNEEKEIVILKEMEGFSCKEIAQMLDIPLGTVMSKLFYARKKLYKKLKALRDE